MGLGHQLGSCRPVSVYGANPFGRRQPSPGPRQRAPQFSCGKPRKRAKAEIAPYSCYEKPHPVNYRCEREDKCEMGSKYQDLHQSSSTSTSLQLRHTRGSYAIPYVSLIFPSDGVSIESRRELWDSKGKCIKFHTGNSKWDPCDTCTDGGSGPARLQGGGWKTVNTFRERTSCTGVAHWCTLWTRKANGKVKW
jgi:hypothetical protein